MAFKEIRIEIVFDITMILHEKLNYRKELLKYQRNPKGIQVLSKGQP